MTTGAFVCNDGNVANGTGSHVISAITSDKAAICIVVVQRRELLVVSFGDLGLSQVWAVSMETIYCLYNAKTICGVEHELQPNSVVNKQNTLTK
jgi:hypothetical protein